MGRMTWTTNMNQRSKWCPPVRCPSGQHSSAVGAVSKEGCAVGAVVGMSTMCPSCVQHAATSVSTKMSKKTQMPSGVQVGQVSDSRVGSMKTKLVSSRSSGFKQMSGKLKLPC